MTQKNFLPYAKQSISAQDIEEVGHALKGAWITRGPEVEAFEKELAAYCGAKYAVAFSSGSAALAGAFSAAGVNRQDRILSSPNTFVASVGPAVLLGANPIFIDIDKTTGNVDLQHLVDNINKLTSRGRPIAVPMHYAGLPIDMEQLDQLIANPDAIVIEDAAQALGSNYPRQGPKVGSCTWSAMTIFSFHPAKILTTGEGGMVTTNSEELYQLLCRFRNNGIAKKGEGVPWYYEVQDLTNNYNFTDFQAALGRSQLKRLDQNVEKRRDLMKKYREKLASLPHVGLLSAEFDDHTAFHLCVALIDFAAIGKTREDVMLRLKEKGIGTQVHYIPLYRHPYFQSLSGEIAAYFPETENFYARALSLPLYSDLSLSEVEQVVEALAEVMNKPR